MSAALDAFDDARFLADLDALRVIGRDAADLGRGLKLEAPAPSFGAKSHCFDEDTRRDDLVATGRIIADAAARWTKRA